MASDYTVNYHLDKYVGTDKPNLRDQYNTAMDKIDAQLLVSSNNAALAVRTAQEALGGVNGKVSESTFNAFVSQTNTALGNKANSSTVTALAETVSQKANQSSLTSEAQTRAAADNALSTRIDGLSAMGNCFGVIGDSFSDSASEWPGIVARNTGLTRVSAAVAGSGFHTNGTVQTNFIVQLRNLKANANWEKIRHLLVYGCVNDWSVAGATASSTKGLIEAFCNEFAQSSYKPKITFVLGNVGAPNRNFTRTFKDYPAYIDEIVEYTRSLGYDAIPAYSWLLGYPNSTVFNTDNLHPNATGHALIAGFMTQILNGTYTGHIRSIYNPIGTYNEDFDMVHLYYDINETTATVSLRAQLAQATDSLPTGNIRIVSAPQLCFGVDAGNIPSLQAVAGISLMRTLSGSFQVINGLINPFAGYCGVHVTGSGIDVATNFNFVAERTFPIS